MDTNARIAQHLANPYLLAVCLANLNVAPDIDYEAVARHFVDMGASDREQTDPARIR